ncbi:MAG: hypothetical protein C0504_16360 [Candidatus Solibacter sp.]|nr:hypothetical protein [Candidatus Solibacter sp.]
MGRLRPLSYREFISIFQSFGFSVHDQRGSHIKLRRVAPNGEIQTLLVPAHAEIDKGTLVSIFRQACRYINPTDLRPRFYFVD